jgi:pimeloyl-ACP methyl ester carboxylesterase
MARATVGGLSIGYEVVGDGGARPWAITPGARDARDTPGLREMAADLADRGNRVLLWDRPNTGESDVCFEGSSESVVQADALAGLLEHLGMTPAVIAGGSGGSRVSLLTAGRHPELAAGLAIWWITGGTVGLMSLGTYYCSPSIRAAWSGGMEAVIALPEWAEVLERNPSNRERFLAQDPATFIETLERWMLAYCPCGDEAVPGLPNEDAARMTLPSLVFRSGASDMHHRRETSEALASVLPNARLVEPPWGDTEWHERQTARDKREAEGLFVRWPLLVPTLTAWADEVLA